VRYVCLLIAVCLPTLAAYAYFALFTSPKVVSTLYSLSKIIEFSLPIFVLYLIDRGRISLRKPTSSELKLGLLFGSAMGGILLAVFWAMKSYPFVSEISPLVRQKLTGFHADTPLKFLMLAIFISVIHSLLEEYYWRWYVHQELTKFMNRNLAVILSSLAFTGHHVIIINAYLPASIHSWGIIIFPLFVFIAGVTWALIYDRWKSLWIPWISHILADVAILWIGYMLVWG
jgi:membrane protease YdiL (CAAX protease family)